MTIEIKLTQAEQELKKRNEEITSHFLDTRNSTKFSDKRIYEAIAEKYNLTWQQIRNICLASGVVRKKRRNHGDKTSQVATR